MYKLLTKTDIENIKEYNECCDAINILAEAEMERIEEDIFKLSESDGFNRDDMNNSNYTLNRLKYEYASNDKGFELLIMGIIFSPMGLLYNSAISNKWLALVVGTFGMWSLITGIKQINIRRKIKNNFKEMGVKY